MNFGFSGKPFFGKPFFGKPFFGKPFFGKPFGKFSKFGKPWGVI